MFLDNHLIVLFTKHLHSINKMFFFSRRIRHTRSYGDWSSDVCSSDVGGLVDENVILAWKEPSERVGRELVPTVAEQVGGGAAHDEVDLEFGMAMGAGASVPGGMPNNPSFKSSLKPEFLDHDKKR